MKFTAYFNMRISHIQGRLEQQQSLSILITQSLANFTKIPTNDLTFRVVNARLTSLKDHWDKFSIIHDAIMVSINQLSSADQNLIRHHVYFTDNMFSTTYEHYLECLDKMNFHLDTEDQLKEGSSSTQSLSQATANQLSISHHTRLPRIDLPKFNGTSSEWLSFKDLFSSIIIRNTTLTAVEKLQYLKSSLTGTASHLLKNTELLDDNFQKAWDDLISFYENRRLLVNAAIQSLFSLKKLSKESAIELEYLYTHLMQIYRTLETLQRPVDKWDDFLVFMAVQRLDSDSVKAWEQHLGSAKDPPTWKQFCDFLITRLLSLQAYEKSRGIKTTTKVHPHPVKSHFQSKDKEKVDKSQLSCVICSSKHYIGGCPQYTSKTIQQRYALLTKHGLCYNCLGIHRVSNCRSLKRCTRCGRKHHTTIHRHSSLDKEKLPDSTKPTNLQETITKATPAQVLQSFTTLNDATSHILLATAQVVIFNQKGSTLQIRALIDQGSEVTLISERVVQMLNLPRSHSLIPLVGIGGHPSDKTRGLTSFKVTSIYDKTEPLELSAHILRKLTNTIPSVKLDMHHWQHLNKLILADPQFLQPLVVDMIIGADTYHQIILEGLKKGPIGSPIAQLTCFGWIISGPMTSTQASSLLQSYHISMDQQLYDLIRKFWETEEISFSPCSSLTPEEQACENYFQNTHSRDQQGRYVVRLPFKKSVEELGNSKHKASMMLTSLLNKFHSDVNYAQAYSNFMSEYKDLHHMKLVDVNQPEPQPNYYLPHHGVWKESSATTKLRVVFNGSSRTTSKISLNDLLHTGPKLQLELLDVLIWFRQFRYAFSTDIEKMYRQINVNPQDWKFQRILWTTSEGHHDIYELTTVTYGTSCAPYLALRTLLQLVEDEKLKYPLAVPCLTKGRYVDDIFGGAETSEAIKEQITQLNQICMAGGFKLQKWTSNLDSILDSLPMNIRDYEYSKIFDRTSYVQTLGLRWQPQSDTFNFAVESPTINNITKRTILSLIAKLFDPLGLLSPIIIKAKVLIQELWIQKVGWDDPLPIHINNKWINFVTELTDVNNINIPRWIGSSPNHNLQIHGFCDASQQAYAASVYLRSTNEKKEITTILILSKTKVAPLKRLTIPRLELTGAVLLTKIVSHVIEVLDLKNIPVFLWTDSSITLTWINTHASKWKDFVQNRVVYIQETLPQAKWNLVSGKENPADIATRGISPSQLINLTLWWEGPTWLSQPYNTWPVESCNVSTSENLEERTARVLSLTSAQNSQSWDLLARYSELKKLLRITAMCMRAAARFKKSITPTKSLTVDEIDKARLFWIKHIQQISFKQEINLLSQGLNLQTASALRRLTPFLDASNLLRTGGRLQHSNLPEDAKHLLILPKQSLLTTLIISDAHAKTLHGGTQVTLAYLRQSYWIVGGRMPVRSFILKCIICTRYRQKRAQQLMGQLPMRRVNPTIRPFLNAGVDYAGPLYIKTWRGKNARQYKAYIAVFVCFSTSASHLELVTEYSADAFIAAYKRFAARRGICATLSSDCGTNLIGADKELRNLFSASSKELEKLSILLANDGTQWLFNPPSAPHFGGKWEANVKSVKYHLKRIIGNQLFTYEEITTLLTQIEAILNSRPMSPLSDDPDDLSALTPGHFLVGDAPTIIPEPMLTSLNSSRLSRWQLLRQMLDSFWTRWSKECLQRYHDISKWNKSVPSLTKGALVLVVDERYPPSKWPLGRIIDVHPGKDGHVRVVTVRTQASVLKRPIVKLCPLPIESTDS